MSEAKAETAGGSEHGLAPAGIWRWFDLIAIAFSILFLVVAAGTSWTIYSQRLPVDFLSYWAAGSLASAGNPALAYSAEAHRAVELAVAPVKGLLPFPYPPPFLLVVTPFGLLSFWLAFPLWLLATAALYALAARSLIGLRYAFAQPPAFSIALGGQNGFLTSSIFISGTALLERRELFAGAMLGLLIIKPQLALMLPFAMIAGRHWRAIVGGVASASAVLLAALALFGQVTYRSFFAVLPPQAEFLSSGRIAWTDLSSIYAMARFFGGPHGAAMAVHAAIALAAAVFVWRAWAQRRPERTAILAAATTLGSPYQFTYDGLLLLVAIAFLVRNRRQPVAVAAIWLLSLLPMARGFAGYAGPNTLAVAAIVAIFALSRDWGAEPER